MTPDLPQSMIHCTSRAANWCPNSDTFNEVLVKTLLLSKVPVVGSQIHSGDLVLNGLYSNKQACLTDSWSIDLIIGC